MAASTIARFATLFAVVLVVCYVSAEPEPTPEPEPEPGCVGAWRCRPCCCHQPVCCASTTTCGALVVPTLATVHSRGKARCHCPACGRKGSCCPSCCC